MRKKSLLFILCIISFFSSICVVNAEDLAKIDDKKLTITIDLSSEDNNFFAYQGKINYDENIFNKIDESNFVINENEKIYFNVDNNSFVLINKGDLASLEINFYLKENIASGFSAIDVQDLVGSDGKKDFNLKNRHIQINTFNNETEVIGISKKANNINYDNLFVGFNIYVIFFIAITFVLILSFSLFLFSNNSKKSKILVDGSIFFFILLSIFCIYLIYYDKNDVNNDDNIDLDDTYDVVKYLIDIEKLKLKSLSSYDSDVNNDGFITITDLSSIVSDKRFLISKKVSEEQNEFRKIELVNIDNNTAKFKIDCNTLPKKIVVDGIQYDILKEDDFYYTYLNIDSNNRKVLVFEKIIFDDNKELEINKKFVIFKNKPSGTDIKLDVDKQNTLNVSFNLKDNDSTISKLKAYLKDENGTILETRNINSNAKSFKFNEKIKENLTYYVEILASYDCNDGSSYENKVLLNSKLENNVSSFNDDKIIESKVSNTYPKKESVVDVTYKIKDSNNVKYIQINDTIYNTQKISDDSYIIKYKVPNDDGVNTLNVQKLIYEDKEYKVNDNSLKIDVLKDKPIIKDFSSYDDIDSEMVMFKFNIDDVDSAFIDGSICLGKECKKIENSGFNTFVFSVTKNRVLDLSININYDLDTNLLSNKNDKSSYTFKSKYALVKNYNFEISNINMYKVSENKPSKYFNKDEDIIIKFNSNNVSPLYPVKIEFEDIPNTSSVGNIYDIKQSYKSDGSIDYYYVTIKAKKSAGVHSLKIKSVILNSGKKIEVSDFKNNVKNIEYEVLKDSISVDNLFINYDNNNLNVSFNIIDKDDSLNSGYINITDLEGKHVYLSESLKKGYNEFSIKVLEKETYIVNIESSYDLDENNKNELNNFNKVILNKKVNCTSNLDFSIKDITITKNVKNGESAIIEFGNSILTNKDVTSVIIDGNKYKVDKNNNYYVVKYKPQQKGVNNIKLEKVYIEDKEFVINKDLSFVYENKKPIVNGDSKIVESDKSTSLNFKIVDEDNTINKIVAILRNSNNEIIVSKTIDIKDMTVTFDLPKSYKYSIELQVEYYMYDNVKKTVELTKVTETKNKKVEVIKQEVLEKYQEKNKYATIEYQIDTNVLENVKYFVINGQIYNAVKLDNNLYQVLVKVDGENKKESFTLTEVQFESVAVSVKDLPSLNINVLKNRPSISDFVIDYQNRSLNFKLNDKDFTTYKLNIEATDENNNKNSYSVLKSVISDYKIDFDKLNIKDNHKYSIKIIATYNLNTNLNFTDQFYEEEILNQSIIINNQESSDLKLNLEDNLVLINNEKNIISFYTNTQSDILNEIVIDEKTYDVNYIETIGTNDYYTFEYVPNNKKSFLIEYGLSSNGVTKKINLKREYSVWNQYPKINITLVNEDSNYLTLKAYVDDFSNVIYKDSVKIVIKDLDRNIIGEKVISKKKKNIEFNISNVNTSVYLIQIYADISLSNDKIVKSSLLYEKEINSKVSGYVSGSKLSTSYPYKGENIDIQYSIVNNNKNNKIVALIINGNEYSVDSNSLGIYSIKYTVKNTSGIENIKLNKIKYSDGSIENISYTDKVDVLKDKPTISNLKVSDNYNKKTITVEFDVNDKDKVIDSDSLKITLGKKSEKIEIGHNKIIFEDVNRDILEKVKIIASYDLDSTKDENNNYQNNILYEFPYILSKDIGLTIENIKTYDNKDESNKFDINQNIILSFESNNTTSLYPTEIVVNSKTYNLYKDGNIYKTTIDGFLKEGIIDISIESVKLNSGKIIKLKNVKKKIEVMKKQA